MPRKITKVAQDTLFQLAPTFGPQMGHSLAYNMPSTRTALNSQVFAHIHKMKRTAAHKNLAYITSNNVGLFESILLINRMTHRASVNSMTDQAYHNPQDYEVFINPKIE